ncbi:uncharacterized protein [Montipora foliosa]|uniref:uncharacterized protein n=1 Tax=Montipora foliosa TaxID=591990 RepID=UPI0035F139F4
MKTFAALIVLSALAAYMSAEEMPALGVHEAVIQFLDDRHYESMAKVVRDEGLPEDTLHLVANDPVEITPSQKRKIAKCAAKAKVCWKNAGHDSCKQLACINEFEKCLGRLIPKLIRKLPKLQQACLGLLHLCRTRSKTCEGELCCFVRIKRCFKFAKANGGD